ncbi:MAG: hypothetical protein ACYS47_09175 [Planctomycetota bacterium]
MSRNSERGTLLIIAVTVVFVVAGMAATMLTVSVAGVKRERNKDTRFKAREIAEAGVDLSLNNLRQATDGVDNDGDGTIDEGTDAYDQFTPFGHYDAANASTLEGQLGRIGTLTWGPGGDTNGNGFPDFGEPGVNPVPFARGEIFAYTVFSERDGIDNDGNGTVDDAEEVGSLTAVSGGRFDGVVSMVMYSGILTDEFLPYDPPTWNPNAAISSGGPMTVSGTSDVRGAGGSIHSNDRVTIQGSSPFIEQDCSACNGVFGNTGQVQGTVNPTAPAMDMPDLRPETFRDRADHVFTANGRILDPGTGQVIWDFHTQGPFMGWGFSVDGNGRPVWTLSGGGANYSGTGFFTTDVKLAGLGNRQTPLQLTLITTENLELHGNGSYTSDMAGTSNLLFAAGGDIKISGSPQAGRQILQGLIAAREQIHQTGTSDVNGVLVASNQDHGHDLVTESRISGTALINYDGNLHTDIPVVYPTNKYVLDPTFAAYEER